MASERKQLGPFVRFNSSFSPGAPVTPNPEVLVSKGHPAIYAVMGGNDVQTGGFARIHIDCEI
jgi:hypothetical protein